MTQTSGAMPVQAPTTTSYKDPAYANIDAGVERKLGLPAGSLSAIRTKGERSNSDQVSEAGAATSYQIIPATRNAVLNKYGVDAYASPANAALAAGHVLKEGLDRNRGDLAQAVGEYHGGPDRRNWGPRTRAYIERAGGASAGQGGADPAGPGPITQSNFRLGDFTDEQIVNMTPTTFDHIAKPLTGTPGRMEQADARVKALLGPNGLAPSPTSNSTDLGADAIKEREAQEVARATAQGKFTVGDKFAAAWEDNSLTAGILRAWDRTAPEVAPGYAQYLTQNWQDIASYAENGDEFDRLANTISPNDLQNAKTEIAQERERRGIYASTSHEALMYGLAGGLLDPAGLVVGLATGGVAEGIGLGSRALYAAGRTGAAVASAAVEGAVGNVATVAGLQATGTYTTTDNYLSAAAFGMAIGALSAPLHFRGAKAEAAALAEREATVDGGANPAATTLPNIKAFHGSPHDEFDKFDFSRIGTGEGNLAYGHGGYFAESEGVANWYWNTLSAAIEHPDGRPKGRGRAGAARQPGDVAAAEATAERSHLEAIHADLGIKTDDLPGVTPEVTLTGLRGILGQAKGVAFDKISGFFQGLADKFRAAMAKLFQPNHTQTLELQHLEAKARIAESLSAKTRVTKPKGVADPSKGTIYQVDLKAGHFLDWDKPLNEQSSHVQEAARGAGYTGPATATGHTVYRELGDGAEASAKLNSFGVKGNKYLDAMSRDGRSNPTYNYVMFNHDDVHIVRTKRNGTWADRPVKQDAEAAAMLASVKALGAAAAERNTRAITEAQTRLGPDATSKQVAKEVQRVDAAERTAWLKLSLADVPDHHKFLSGDELLTKPDITPGKDGAPDVSTVSAFTQGIIDRYNLSAISDDAERGIAAEQVARAERMLDANPINKDALKTLLNVGGLQSTGLRLLASESPVAKAMGITLLEGSTGASGRRMTAAISLTQRERIYNKFNTQYDNYYRQFRKDRGVGALTDSMNGKVRNEFNKRVALELEARGLVDTGTFDPHPAVVSAADDIERGFDHMRIEQQTVGTVGNARLGTTSRGYMPHQVQGRVIAALTKDQHVAIRKILSDQFVDIANGFDREFADKFAVRYLEMAAGKARQAFDVPLNLHNPEAADIINDVFAGMKMGYADRDKLMGKFSRGGASHTKKRLRLDLSETIPDGKGGKMQLIDLFNTDVPNLYRSQARRVAGDVSLAKYGVMGKKGLAELRKAAEHTGASIEDLQAIDQVSAEFLNAPFGDANHNWMDNTRILASVSRLGGMGFTQFAEFGNSIAHLGVTRAFGAISAMPRMFREVGMMKKGLDPKNGILGSIDTLGGELGMDDFNLTRLFDIKDDAIQLYGTEHVGVASRFLRAGANLQAGLSGHRMILASQIRSMAEQIVHKAVGFAKSGLEDKALDDMGISARLRELIKQDLPKIAEFNGDKLVKLDLMKAEALKPADVAELVQAIERGSSQIIQRTYIGETGKWAHNGLLKMLFQFRTFSLISVEKQWGRNKANYGAMKSFMYLMGAMSFAAPIHMARVQLKTAGMSRSERKAYLDKYMTLGAVSKATLNYASASGVAGDLLDIGGGFASTLGGQTGKAWAAKIGAGGAGPRGAGSGALIGDVIAPGVGWVNDVNAGLHGDPKALAHTVPGSSLPFVVPLVNGMTGK